MWHPLLKGSCSKTDKLRTQPYYPNSQAAQVEDMTGNFAMRTIFH